MVTVYPKYNVPVLIKNLVCTSPTPSGILKSTMSFTSKWKFSESAQIVLLLTVILILILFFLLSAGRIFRQIIFDQRLTYLLEDSFELTEYNRLLKNREKMKKSARQLQMRLQEFQENDYIKSMNLIRADFRVCNDSLQESLETYMAGIRGMGKERIDQELVDVIRTNFDSILTYLYTYKSEQVKMLQLMNTFIIMSFFLSAAIAVYADIERNRQLHLKEGLRSLNRRNLFEYENESKRISYTIHDHVLQDLEITRMALETLGPDELPSEVRERLSVMRGSLNESIGRLRDIINGLPAWDTTSFSFESNIRNLIEAVDQQFEGEAQLQILGLSKLSLRREEMEQLLSILHEALYNVVKHSRAERVKVKVLWAQPVFRMIVEDNGVGFRVRDVETYAGSHLGFLSMQERAHSIGAKLEVRSTPGKGSRIVIKLRKDKLQGRNGNE